MLYKILALLNWRSMFLTIRPIKSQAEGARNCTFKQEEPPGCSRALLGTAMQAT